MISLQCKVAVVVVVHLSCHFFLRAIINNNSPPPLHLHLPPTLHLSFFSIVVLALRYAIWSLGVFAITTVCFWPDHILHQTTCFSWRTMRYPRLIKSSSTVFFVASLPFVFVLGCFGFGLTSSGSSSSSVSSASSDFSTFNGRVLAFSLDGLVPPSRSRSTSVINPTVVSFQPSRLPTLAVSPRNALLNVSPIKSSFALSSSPPMMSRLRKASAS